MGLTYVKVKLSAPGAKKKPAYEADFLVDSGAEDSLVPTSALRKIGIDPEQENEYELADGTFQTLPYGIARFEILGRRFGGNVAFGPEDIEPILGVLALEEGGFVLDPKERKLLRRPRRMLK